MSSLREKIAERREVLVSQSHSCIPKVMSNEPFDYATRIFRRVLNSPHPAEKLSVIDPYIVPIDLDNLTSLFGGSNNTNLEIISKFESSKSEEEKNERKKRITERKGYLLENGLFRTIELIHSTENMHDRYFLYWNSGIIIKAFCIGGSVAQRFDDYIGIIEITDKFMLNNIETYYKKLIINTVDFLKS